MTACAQCGAELRDDARFCDRCGAALQAATRPRETRKVVTVLFCDVVGFTAAGERLDPEALRRLQSRYFDEARAALERHGGTVEKFIGDAVMAVFGIPQVHEDDALRAVRAAVELREALTGLELEARIGINTGEVVAGSGEALVTGDAVNTAKRLEEQARPAEILLGEQTHRLVRDAVEAKRSGSEGKRTAYRLSEVLVDAPAFARRLDAPLVGREHERGLLAQAFERAARERACHLFTLLGPAGIGKSRLIEEFVRQTAEAAVVLSGRCLPYGEGITFWPVLEMLRVAGSEARLDEALGAGTIEETFWTVRKELERIAGERPLVAVFDDLHWAESTLLDLIEHVADWSRGAAILLVCIARPELLDARPGWAGGKLNATSLLLEPLSDSECDELLEHLLGESEFDEAVRWRITEAAEGNPLFVEQMVAMASENGAGEVEVPPTIQALIAARIDRLAAPERTVLECASIEGKVFHRGAVAELSDGSAIGELMTLVRKELIRPEQADFPEEDAFRFRHLLIRDAAYESLPKEARAELHERFADWLERRVGDHVSEYEEILGYHLEQAHRRRTEIGPVDDVARALGRRAAERLATAGLRALARSDMPAAANLLGRTVALLPAGDATRLELLPELGAALTDAGDLGAAEEVLAEAVEGAGKTGDRRVEFLARLQRAYAKALTDPSHRYEDADEESKTALSAFEELGDEAGMARAWHVRAVIMWWSGRCGEAETAWEQAVEHALRAGDDRKAAESLPWLTNAACYGPRPAPEAERRCAEIVERAKRNRKVEGWAHAARAPLAAMQGRFDDAREHRRRAKELLTELGLRLDLALHQQKFGYVELLAGDLEAAEAEYRQGYDLSEEMRETGYFSTVAGLLADAVCRQGRYEEAIRLTEEAEAAGALDDVFTQMLWRTVRGRALARHAEPEHAEALVRQAVALARQTEYVNDTADALTALAETLRLAGKSAEAREPLEEALVLYERKGNVVFAERTRAALAELR